jgi:hypothetical protein
MKNDIAWTMKLSRRSILKTVGGASALLAGCISNEDEPASSDDTAAPTTQAASPSVRENQSNVSVETTANESKYEYIDSENAVRYVAAYRHSNPEAVENGSPPTREPVYDTMPFERWAETECAHVGSQKVAEVMETRLDGNTSEVTAGVTTQNGNKTVIVTRSTVFNREGEVKSTPSTSYKQLEAVAPSTVAATVSLENRSHTCTVPVAIENVHVREE